MDDTAQLDLDLSALELDDFEVADQEITIDSLTSGHAGGARACGCYCGGPCGCACVP